MSLKIVHVVDYGAGNIGSLRQSLMDVGATVTVVNSPSALQSARNVILPGVGSFARGVAALRQHGLFDELTTLVNARKVNLLGVCLGLQLLATVGTEGGEAPGLNAIQGAILKIPSAGGTHRVPHMGWNEVELIADNEIVKNLPTRFDAYFVHSYVLEPKDPCDIVGITEHGVRFPSIVAKGNIFGAQFHPEKSGKHGLEFLNNFIRL